MRGPRGARAAVRPRARQARRGRLRASASRAVLGVTRRTMGLIDRLFARHGARRGDGRRRSRAAKRAGMRTGHDLELVGRGPATTLDRFPSCSTRWVISGEEGLRKPDPAIYALGAERIGLPPEDVRLRRRPARQPQARAGDGDGDGPPRRRRADDPPARGPARRRAALVRARAWREPRRTCSIWRRVFGSAAARVTWPARRRPCGLRANCVTLFNNDGFMPALLIA